ncbi:hypothetical protein, partial [Pseudomonas bubulae]|uniref:hypothetical protein n=1 Tax=Pseudomonas bubulae TaxID=2316085 RepID=UPI002B1E6B47
ITSTVTITPSNPGCPGIPVSFTITVIPSPTIIINPATVCIGSAGILTATPSIVGGTYLWNTGATTNTITQTPLVTTTYTVTYTLNGCATTK